MGVQQITDQGKEGLTTKEVWKYIEMKVMNNRLAGCDCGTEVEQK